MILLGYTQKIGYGFDLSFTTNLFYKIFFEVIITFL